MKNKFVLALTVAAISLGGAAFGSVTAYAETPAAQFQIKKSMPTTPTGPTSIAIPAVMKCMPGYSNTDEHKNANGAVDRFECTSPVFECPHKNIVKNSKGASATGQGIDIKKVPVGPVGDANKFKIEYSCTYIWNQG